MKQIAKGIWCFCLLVMLSGCAEPEYHWEHVDGRHDRAAFEKALAECRYEVDRMAYQTDYGPGKDEGGGVGGALKGLGDAMGQAGDQMTLFSDCMHAKGLHEVPGPPPAQAK